MFDEIHVSKKHYKVYTITSRQASENRPIFFKLFPTVFRQKVQILVCVQYMVKYSKHPIIVSSVKALSSITEEYAKQQNAF